MLLLRMLQRPLQFLRASDRIKVILYTAKPGVVIGKGGAEIEKVKAELVGSDKQLRIATNKVEDVTVKKLTRDNPTMQAKFKALKGIASED